MTDAGSRGIVKRALLWAVIAGLGAAALLYGIFWLPYREPGSEPPRTLEILPPRNLAPTAADVPPGDYGWVDRDAGIVHIPVDEAMQEVIKTLPVRADPVTPERRSPPPTDAASGRQPPRPDR